MRSESAHRRADYHTFATAAPSSSHDDGHGVIHSLDLDDPSSTIVVQQDEHGIAHLVTVPSPRHLHHLPVDVGSIPLIAGRKRVSPTSSLSASTVAFIKAILPFLLTFLAGIFATQATTLQIPHLRSLAPPSSPPALSSAKSLGRTVGVSGVHYYVPATATAILPVRRPPVTWSHTDLFPITVLSSPERLLTDSHISTVIATYAQTDDVWTPAFAENLLLHYSGHDRSAYAVQPASFANSTLAVSGYASRFLKKAATVNAIGKTVTPGPYFASYGDGKIYLHQAWRLYEDTARAFFQGVIPDEHDASSFFSLHASIPHSVDVASIAVPSRLYFTKTAEKPLAGVRVAVKDSINLRGLKTSMASRAWLSLYPAAKHTAPSIQHLIDLGAVIVGKTRLSQLVTGAYGTADGVDFGVPHNARGDGMQEPSSSSSGAGAAAGAYKWLDMSIGTDTGGSVRAPAAYNGAFGFRPSTGAVNMSGILPSSPAFDTLGFLASEAASFAEYGRQLYSTNDTFRQYPELPRQLLYMIDPRPDSQTASPGFFPTTANPAAEPIFEQFVQALEGLLGIQRTKVDFYARFEQKFGMIPPAYIGKAWSLITGYDQYHVIGKQFVADYQAANAEHHPILDPPVQQHWEYAQGATVQERDLWVRRKDAFTHFVESEFMARNSSQSCSNALTVFPTNVGVPSYKSDYHMPKPIFEGWNRYSIAQLGQVPEVIIPIGQVPYQSKLTRSTKYLPVSISIQAAAGCDFVLFSLVERLAEARIIRNPTPGHEETFPRHH